MNKIKKMQGFVIYTTEKIIAKSETIIVNRKKNERIQNKNTTVNSL